MASAGAWAREVKGKSRAAARARRRFFKEFLIGVLCEL
jgi:hypothetical protein